MKTITRGMLLLILMISIPLNISIAADTRAIDDELNDLRIVIEALDSRISLQEDIISQLRDQIANVSNGTPSSPLPKNPILMVTDPLYIELKPNTFKQFDLTIRNLTTDSAKNIVTTVSSDTPGIVAMFESDNYKSSVSSRGSYSSTLRLSVDSSVNPGYYALNFNHDFLDNDNNTKSSKSIMQIKITSENDTLSNTVLDDIKLSSQDIYPDMGFDLSAMLINTEENVMDVSITFDSPKTDGIFIRESTDIMNFPSLNHNVEQLINIPLNTDKNIKPGSYPITLKLSYTKNGSSESKDYTYYINVRDDSKNDTEQKGRLTIPNILAPTQDVQVGSDFNMSFDLYNNSGRQVNNIKITATPQADGEIVPKSANIVQIDTLEENTSIPINFTFAATTSSKSQNYVISFLIEYETGATNDDDTKEIASFTQYQGVNINNPDSQDNNTKMSIPKIIVKEYSSSPVIVRSGQEFDLYMTFQNTNIDRSVKNIKAFLTVDEGTESKGSVFSPVNSSNTFYIDNIDPKGEVSQTLRMYTIPDAQPKTYTINVNFEYEDDNNEPYSSIEKIGINVKQTTKLSLSEITVDEQAFVGEPLNINFEMYNTGKVTLSNLMIYVEGPFDTTQKSQYYGSFSSSSTEYYDNRLTPTEPGEQTLKVIISYEDDSGEEIREEKEILINVEEKIFEEPDPMLITDLDTTDSGSSSSSIILYIICFLILLILIVGFIFYRKHKKKKERFDLDE